MEVDSSNSFGSLLRLLWAPLEPQLSLSVRGFIDETGIGPNEVEWLLD